MIELNKRKKAQRLILVEHVFNTLADRMWLYAAGLSVSRLKPKSRLTEDTSVKPIFPSILSYSELENMGVSISRSRPGSRKLIS